MLAIAAGGALSAAAPTAAFHEADGVYDLSGTYSGRANVRCPILGEAYSNGPGCVETVALSGPVDVGAYSFYLTRPASPNRPPAEQLICSFEVLDGASRQPGCGADVRSIFGSDAVAEVRDSAGTVVASGGIQAHP